MKFLILLLIRTYQLCIAPFIGQVCRFTPSCSHYAIDAVKTHGSIKGGWMAFKRILRCNPYCQSGYDPVDSNSKLES